MGAFLIYKELVDTTADKVKGIKLIEIDKREDEAQRYVKLYNLQRTLDEKNNSDYRVLYIDVI